MRSDNGVHTMKLTRFLAKAEVLPWLVAGIDITLFLMFTYILNAFSQLGLMIKDNDNMSQYLGLSNFIPHISKHLLIYFIFFVLLAILNAIWIYQMRVNLSDKEMTAGHKATSRWTTQEEIRKQYKAIPISDEFFDGEGGIIVQRQGKMLYIDDSKSNNLIIGTTRSGKGEMYVLPSIDVYSRAKKLCDRPSMIISDPKLELFKCSKKTLEQRGYIVKLLNLDDPLHSMGYNPLQLVINYYKQGDVAKAQMSAKTFSFSIFAADNSTQEPIWKNTATDLFTALIIAITTDCMDSDRELNERRRKIWIEKRAKYDELTPEEQDIAKHRFYEKSKMESDYILMDYNYIPEEVSFYQIYPNERKINAFSCLNLFRELCDRKALERAGSEEEREKIAETALDEYFNSRPPLDYAKALYQEIKTAGSKTKGSVYINMQSALSIFALDNIARLTAENDVDIDEIGYGDKPVAIFIGIPSEDRSNHFLVTTFIAQVYQRLFQISKTKEGKKQGVLERKVKFILDEFGNFPEIENLSGFLTVCLGLGISFDLYVQSLNQISDKYKDNEKTILENLANQIYIKSVGEETAKTFSEILGNQEVVEVQRSGSRFSLDKNFTETSSERPLMYHYELARLREGECVIYRGIKRTDRLATAIKSYPIINEYADDISFIDKIRLRHKVNMRKEPLKHPTDDRITTKREEYQIRRNEMLQKKGTALLYRYQYLTDTFPNPDTIRIEDVNKESREHIDYTKMIYEPSDALKKAENRSKKKYLLLKEAENYTEICGLLNTIDSKWRKEFDCNENDTISKITEKICKEERIPEELKESILRKLEIGGEVIDRAGFN